MEVRREEGGLVATRSGADFDDRGAIVEGIAREQERRDLTLELSELGDKALLFGAGLLGHFGVVNRNELAHLHELVFRFL
jgi:hypothetical protein